MPDELTTAAHLDAARRRGRGLLGREADQTGGPEILQAAAALRESALSLMVLWAILQGLGATDLIPPLLSAAALAMGVFSGVAHALAVAGQLRHCERELRRERDEIRLLPCREREEIRAIYEAKGFSGEMLSRILDTLSADEDRLLKVMMEEELGLFFEQRNHPVILGVIVGAAGAFGGLVVALAARASHPAIPLAAAAALLLVAAAVRSRGQARLTFESFARWLAAGSVVCGIGYFLGQWYGS